jgi:mannose-1-phosphate guanylyltransferase
VFLLAAGLGTRLRPLTDWLPKPLLPVGDRPALAHILERVRPVAGTLVANAHHRAGDLRAFLAVAAPEVRLSEEAHILGTAGGLAHAGRFLGPGDVLVWNGDILSSLDAAALLKAHAHEGLPEATLAVRAREAGEGNVGTDRHGRIVRLRRETAMTGEVSGGDFLGIHVVGEGLRRRLPVEGCLVGDVYLPALREGRTLRAFEVSGVTWHDIGSVVDYEAANFAWLAAKGEGSFVGPGAVVESGVALRESIVGAEARVVGEGVVERCIIWPGATVKAPCASRVVTPEGTVPLRG